MALTAEAIVDRRRLKRRLALWRVVAVLAIIVALVVAGLSALSRDAAGSFTDHIARIKISGLITGEQKQISLLKNLGKSKRVKAVLVNIDSPGGTTAGSEAVYEEIRKLSGKKPVVSVLGSQATSGGYITAIAGDYIVARGNTLTGSIGVIFQWPQIRELMEKLGVRMREVKSDPLKAEPSPFTEPSPEALTVMQDIIRDSHDWFLKLVQERRDLDEAMARKLGDGRVYTGRQALEAKLIDKIGGEDEALAWLRKEKKIAAGLKVVDWRPSIATDLNLPGVWLRQMGRAIGLSFAEGLAEGAEKTLAPERLKLDGPLFLWQPAN
ncbi:MAG: signal peptide peptidase SppA [Pseudomonadota bacterium]